MNRPRAVFLTIFLLCLASLGGSYATSPIRQAPDERATNETLQLEGAINGTNVSESRAIAAGEGVTVVATQGFYVSDEEAELVAFASDGSVVYHDDTYRVYFDVDPVPDERYTVEYVAAEHLNGSDCTETKRCTRNVVERVNLTTGETTSVYGEVTPRIYSARWHDVDRLNDTHLVVADIVNDGVYVVDTRNDEVTWRWNASSDFSPESGGKENDWTHVNDVEVLADGTIMASLRNQDQVVFLDPGEGLIERRTLGADDSHEILYEQHNPDYIPAERGGPAVLVADSENNRVVEYNRTDDGAWQVAWRWRDARLQWPRDADRLPNGNTLVVDSHGDRVVEVSQEGEVVWSVHVGMAYDAERLGTGDESAGGYAHGSTAGGPLALRGGLVAQVVVALKDVLPSIAVNGLLYAGPSWFKFVDLLVAAVLALDLLGWGVFEFRRSSLTVRTLPNRLAGLVRSAF